MLTFKIGTGRINCLAFSPSGDCLAVGSGDRTLYLLHWPGGDIRWRLPVPNNRCVARCIGFRPDGKTVSAVFTDARTIEWDVESGAMLTHFESAITTSARPVAIWHAGPQLGWEWCYSHWQAHAIAAVGQQLEREVLPLNHRANWIWPLEQGDLLGLTGKTLTHYQRQTEKFDANPSLWRRMLMSFARPILGISAPALLVKSQVKLTGPTPAAATIWPDRKSVLVGDKNGRVRHISRDDRQLLHEWGLPVNKVFSLASSPDGTVAAAGSNNGEVLIWDIDG